MSGHKIAKSISHFLPSLLVNKAITDGQQRLGLQRVWHQAVTGNLAQHTQAWSYAEGELTVVARTSVWASKIRQQLASLCTQLREFDMLRDLRAIKIRVLPQLNATAPMMLLNKFSAQESPKLSPSSQSMLREVATHTEDPALRAALLRLAGAHTPPDTQ